MKISKSANISTIRVISVLYKKNTNENKQIR